MGHLFKTGHLFEVERLFEEIGYMVSLHFQNLNFCETVKHMIKKNYENLCHIFNLKTDDGQESNFLQRTYNTL